MLAQRWPTEGVDLPGTVTIADIIDVDGTPRSYPKSKIVRRVPLSQRCLTALRDHLNAYPPAGSLGDVAGHLAWRGTWSRHGPLSALDTQPLRPHRPTGRRGICYGGATGRQLGAGVATCGNSPHRDSPSPDLTDSDISRWRGRQRARATSSPMVAGALP
ncbi:MAG: hypothetical protein ACRDQ4_03065 [Pseudonocardiaceae bacterium]